MTYAQTKGDLVTDWFDVIARGKAGFLSDEDHEHYYELAGRWVTCACGNTCSEIPRTPTTGSPRDADLRRFGYEFSDAVYRGDWDHAGYCLGKIEKRSAELLAKL